MTKEEYRQLAVRTPVGPIDTPVRKEFLPFNQPDIEQAEIDEVVDALRSGWITTGPKVRQFEADFAAAVEAKAVIPACATSSGAFDVAIGNGRSAVTVGLNVNLVGSQASPVFP